MINILMGNVYNVEQISTPEMVASGKDATKVGLNQWKAEVRKQLMEKLKGYAPEQVERIIQTTFGDSYV
jgi:hypothetical protein